METRKLEEYGPFILGPHDKKLDIDKLRKLHECVADFKGKLISDHSLQDLLLNRGYEMEEPRPNSYHDLHDAIFHRKFTNLLLGFANSMIKLATRPKLVVIKSPLLLVPGQKDTASVETPEGFNAEKIEDLQRDWFKETDIRETVRKYQETLSKAFDEYNLKFVLNAMYHSRYVIGRSKRNIDALQRRIEGVMFDAGKSTLDSSYYDMGNRFFSASDSLWKKLNESDFGKKFILFKEDISEALKAGY